MEEEVIVNPEVTEEAVVGEEAVEVSEEVVA